MEWALQHGIHLHFIEPGNANQNAYTVRINKNFCTEVLDMRVFVSLDDIREVSEQWHHAYGQLYHICTARGSRNGVPSLIYP